jgi:hypothetical protein
MPLSAKRKSIALAVLALVLMGAAMFWATRSGMSQKPLAAVALGDGRILQVEAVTYGVNHHIGNEGSDNLLWRLTARLPGPLYERFASKNPEAKITGLESPALVVWVNAVSEAAGTNLDCQGIRVELVNERGEYFESETSSWFGRKKFWRVGHVFKIYPRDESKLILRVTNWKNNQISHLEIPNPHVVRSAAWTGQDLPQQKSVGDLDIVLAGLRLRTNNASPKYYETRTVYWEPVWELRRGAEKVDGWTEPEWLAEDALGNRGQYLGTNQPVLRFSATFYPAATNAGAAQLLATLPQTPVTNLQTIVWWNQTVRHGSNDILALGLFPPGTRVFEDGVLLTNPPVSMGATRGGAPSGWTGARRAVNPLKVVHYSGHYSTTNSVIYVSAPKLGRATPLAMHLGDKQGEAGQALKVVETRLAMRLRDEQGRNWVATPESQGAVNGIYPFLVQLPPDATQITPELVLLKPVEAEFTVKTSGTPAAGGDAPHP